MRRILFITGTGTGVGKTVLTAMLLHHLRENGVKALALKPFCSGSRGDARLLHGLQRESTTLDETNPYFFAPPLSPWVAVKEKQDSQVPFREILAKIRHMGKRADVLLVEGSGGLLAPLGDNYAATELISRLGCETVVVGANCLGTINHTLLTVRYLQMVGIKGFKVVLMQGEKRDPSCGSNANAIRELAPEIPVFSVGNLGKKASKMAIVKKSAKKMKKTLAQIIGNGNVASFLPTWESDCETIPVDNRTLKR